MQYILSEVNVISILDKNMDLFSQNSILKDAIRMLGWGIIKFLTKLAASAELLFDKAFSLIDITTWLPITNFGKSFSPVFKIVLCISIFAIGLMLLFKNEKLNVNPIVSIILFFFVTISGVTVIGQLNTVVKLGKDNILGKQENLINSIIQNDFYDLLYIDKKQGLAKLENEEPVKYASLSDKDIEYINITEVINPNSDHITTSEAREILGNYIFVLNGELTKTEVYNGFGWNSKDDADFGNQFYYRYSYNFWTISLGLIVIILVYILSGFKEIQFIYDIVTSSILAPIFSSDMSSSAKIKKILIGIRDGYISMLFIVLNIRIFFFFKEYISTAITSNPFVRVILELFVAIVVIDGPNVMEKLSGRDVGMKAGMGGVIASVYATKMAKDGAMNTIRSVRNATHSAKTAANNIKDKVGATNKKDMPGSIGKDVDTDSNKSMPKDIGESTNKTSEKPMPDNIGDMNSKDPDKSMPKDVGEDKGLKDIPANETAMESKDKNADMKNKTQPEDNLQKKNMDAMKGHIDGIAKNTTSGEQKNRQIEKSGKNHPGISQTEAGRSKNASKQVTQSIKTNDIKPDVSIKKEKTMQSSNSGNRKIPEAKINNGRNTKA